jgi:hypothetical protein
MWSLGKLQRQRRLETLLVPFAYPAPKKGTAMRLLPALLVFGLAGCGDRTPRVDAEAPATVPSSAMADTTPDADWNATGPRSATIPEEFRGRWDATAESCREISDAQLKVTDRTLIFWEVGVDVRTVTPVGANAIRIEGTGREEEAHFDSSNVFQLSADGSVLTMNPGPNGFARIRCLTPDFPGVETR